MTTITSTSELPRRCLFCHTKIRHPSHHVSSVSQSRTPYVFWHLPLCGQPISSCSISTTSIPTPTKTMMGMTSNIHAPTLFHPPLTQTVIVSQPHPDYPTPTPLLMHLPSPRTQFTIHMTNLDAQHVPIR